MSCSKKTQNASSTLTSLPLEILADILIKLPPKSLVQIRCVSKFFCSLVFDHPDLHSNWALTLPSKMSIFIIARWVHPHRYYTTNYPQEKNRGTLKLTRIHHMEEDQDLFRNLYLRSCVNGLLCFCPYPQSGDRIVIHNPSTTQHISLPTTSVMPSHFVCAFLGFDSVSRRYKVLKSTINYYADDYIKHWIFTLGVDKSWREINCFPSYFPYYSCGHPFYFCYFSTNVHINGVIYSFNSKSENMFYDIVAFDVATENFHKILPPKQVKYIDSGLIEVEGRLAIIYGCGLIEVEGRLAIIYGHLNKKCRRYDMWIWILEESSMEWENHIIPIPISLKEYHRTKDSWCSSLVFFTANHIGEIALLVKLSKSVSLLFYNFRKQSWRSFYISDSHDSLSSTNMMWKTAALQFIVDNIYNIF